jgi:hypothetical protein
MHNSQLRCMLVCGGQCLLLVAVRVLDLVRAGRLAGSLAHPRVCVCVCEWFLRAVKLPMQLCGGS